MHRENKDWVEDIIHHGMLANAFADSVWKKFGNGKIDDLLEMMVLRLELLKRMREVTSWGWSRYFWRTLRFFGQFAKVLLFQTVLVRITISVIITEENAYSFELVSILSKLIPFFSMNAWLVVAIVCRGYRGRTSFEKFLRYWVKCSFEGIFLHVSISLHLFLGFRCLYSFWTLLPFLLTKTSSSLALKVSNLSTASWQTPVKVPAISKPILFVSVSYWTLPDIS